MRITRARMRRIRGVGHKGMKSAMWTSWTPSPSCFHFTTLDRDRDTGHYVWWRRLFIAQGHPAEWANEADVLHSLSKLRSGCPQVWTRGGQGLGPKWWGKGDHLSSYLVGEIGPLSFPGHGSVLGAEIRKGSRVYVRDREKEYVCEIRNHSPVIVSIRILRNHLNYPPSMLILLQPREGMR